MARALLQATLAVALLLVAAVSANSHMWPERLRGGAAFARVMKAEHAHHERLGFIPNTTKNWFDQLIDHTNPSLGTFKDKYYYDTTYWNTTNNGPCIMYLNGEGPLGAAVGGYMADIAKALGACTLSIEHRWYGESLPAPLTDKALLTSTLTVDQAMMDVAALMNYFETSVIAKPGITWVLIGGSYSGGMTVWMNEKYPGKFKASWAASGVVYATFDYVDYDGHVKKVTSRDCSGALKFIMETAEAWYDNPLLRPTLLQMFNIPAYNTKTDVMWAFADASASSVQYGMKTNMCNAILPINIEDPAGALQKYADMVTAEWGPMFMASCYYSTKCLADSSMAAQWGPAGYSWVWECCNEMAWWQVGYPESIRSRNITVAYFMNQCRTAFWNTTMPDTWAFNKRHHGRQPETLGYIVATQGSDDPWSTTGLKVSQGPTFPVNTAQCTNCGHCGAMMSPQSDDPWPLVAQRQLVLSSLQTWLARS